MTDIDRSLDEIVQKMKRTTFFGIERNGNSFGHRRNSYHKQNSYGQNNGQRETRSYGIKHQVHFKRPFPNQPYRMSWRSNNKSHVRHQHSLLLSGLAPTVTFEDLVELFSKDFHEKPLIKMHYNHNRNMIGTAEIIFKQERCARHAIELYDNVPLDNYTMSLTMTRPDRRGKWRDTHGENGASDFTKYKYKKQREMPNKEDLDQELDEFMSQNNNRVGNSPKTPGIFGNSIPTSVRDPRLKSRIKNTN